ncbi:MAG: TPM domain-containing protein [Bacteroidetes bacterium]|nr:TPM domain-containing protein [Bacteroidota bacterium]
MGDSIYTFFTAEEKLVIRSAIEQAEKMTSGEIRVHIDNRCAGDVLNRASQLFSSLHMHKTELRNGILFYLAVKDRKFAILGDAGINKLVPDGFWEEIKNEMMDNFKRGQFTTGLESGILKAGDQLKKYFPYLPGEDINELSDDISFEQK